MKLNFFSPLPPTRSDIARVTTNLLPFLAEKAEIVVWSSESKWDPAAEQIVGDDEANGWQKREQRSPFQIQL